MSDSIDKYHDMEDRFFHRVMIVRDKISKLQNWKKEYLKNRMLYPAWTTRNGKKIPVYKMETGHLKCALRYLKNLDAKTHEDWITLFENELQFRELLRLEREDDHYTEIIAVL